MSAAALAHSQNLASQIHAEIKSSGGLISFRRFMEIALYEPGLGYYSAGARKFGESGDFITAPEISSLFSRCLARQCEQVLTRLGGGVILELGAGSGAMACDIVNELDNMHSLPDEYLILETSADLRQRQADRIHSGNTVHPEKFRWLDSLPDNPINGLIIANEVIDALPVERICYQDGTIYELKVRSDGNGFDWQTDIATEEISDNFRGLLNDGITELPDGYKTEINCNLPAWINSLGDIMESGVILFIDYGYPRHEFYHPQRKDGTLLCHYRHHVHYDPFINIGLQDITSSVDFTYVCEAAYQAGLSLHGYCSQAHFLLSCGLDDLVNDEASKNLQSQIELANQVKQLTLPGEMGERFKALALVRNYSAPLMGFQIVDHSSRL